MSHGSRWAVAMIVALAFSFGIAFAGDKATGYTLAVMFVALPFVWLGCILWVLTRR